MKKTILLLLLLPAFVHLQSQTVAAARCQALGKGMNLSNWLEASWQSGFPTTTGYTKADLQRMKDAGVQSIRLPVCFAVIIDSTAPYYIDTNHALFTRIDSVLQWTTDLQLNLIIDNHHEWSLINNNWRYQIPRFAHLWSVVAQRYKNTNPNRVSFELLNEPAILFALDSLNILFNTAIDTIRSYTTAHTITVSPNAGSAGLAYSNYHPLADTNLIYTWHCYDPINFTHQGFSWGTIYPSGTPFPSSPTTFYEQFLYDGINRVNQWRNTYHLPVSLGEFGVSRHADNESRCRWIQLMGANLDSTDIPWFYWDWQWDFSMFNSQVIGADSVIPCFRSALHLYGDTISLGIAEAQTTTFQFDIYPNPVASENELHLRTNTSSPTYCSVTNALGEVLHTEKFTYETILRMNYSKGIYFIQLFVPGTGTKIKRVVIQ